MTMTPDRFNQLRERALALLGQTDAARVVEEMSVLHAELELQAEELQRTQRSSDEARRRYIELFRCAPVGLFVIDAGQLINEANDAGAEFLLTTSRLLRGVAFAQFIAPADLPKWKVFLQHPRPTEFAMRRWGGGQGVAILRTLQLDGDTRVLALEDVTQQRQSAGESSGRGDAYQGYLHGASEAVVVIHDLNQSITDASDAACALLEMPREQLVGRSHDELYAPEDRARAGLLVDQLRGQPGQWASTTLRTRGGFSVPVSVRVTLPARSALRFITFRDERGAAR
jgi:PAS domain S-box-containing protein